MSQTTNLPRAFLIAGFFTAALFLLALGTGIGIGIGMNLRQPSSAMEAVPVPLPPLVVKPTPVSNFDRDLLVGTWEPWPKGSAGDSLVFKMDGTGSAGLGKTEWNLQGGICTVDVGGKRFQYRTKFEGDKLILSIIVGNNEGINRFPNLVFKRIAEK